MGEKTDIAWCHHTFNPWWGCAKISAGCAHCYAERWAERLGFDLWGPDAPRRFFGRKHWDEPLRWNAKAAAAGVRRRVFCGSMCDLFEDREELESTRMRVFELIDLTPNLDWLLLTKRPENINGMVPQFWNDRWPANAWGLVTVEDQAAAGRIDVLRSTKAPIIGVSAEPLLGPLDLSRWLFPLPLIEWLIIGCEKLAAGRPGRRCDPAWVRNLIGDCRAAGVPIFVKQLEVAGRVSADPADWPEEFRVQQFPGRDNLLPTLSDLKGVSPH